MLQFADALNIKTLHLKEYELNNHLSKGFRNF